MSNDGTANFLPFEALGGRVMFRGHSSGSNVFQPFTTSGSSYGHMRVAMTLPSLTMSGRLRADTQTEIVFTLPSLRVQLYTGATFGITLPSLKLSASLTLPNLMRVAMTLPSLKATADMLIGGMSEIRETLPMLQMFMRFGARFAMTLPSLTATMHLLRKDDMAITMHLQPLQLAMDLVQFSGVMSIHMTLPALQGSVVRAEFNLELPALQMHAVMHEDYTKNITQAWAWNVRKNAMTRYTDYAYRTFVRFNNLYYGVGFDGVLYQLDGDTDNGAVIPWAWETGLDDMDSAAMKGMLGVYIMGRLERGATLTLRTAQNLLYTYRTTTDERAGQSDYRTYRVITGKGLRSSTFGIGMQSTVGGRMLVSRVAPYMVISKRNV